METTNKNLRYLSAGLLVYCVLYLVVYCQNIASGSFAIGGDFEVFFNAAKLAVSNNFAAIYNVTDLEIYMSRPDLPYRIAPFPYPPQFLIFLIPLGLFTFMAAFGLWLVSGVTIFFLAWKLVARKFLFPNEVKFIWPLLMPFTLMAIISGQTGFFVGALLLLVLYFASSRPYLSGILLGLLMFKPQFCVVIIIALLAQRNFKALITGGLTFALFATVSILLFGTEIWLNYFTALETFGRFIQLAPSEVTNSGISPYLELRVSGVPHIAALILQLIVSAIALYLVYRSSRKDFGLQQFILILTAGFVATPYLMIYDMPTFAAALALFAVYSVRKNSRNYLLLILAACIPFVTIGMHEIHLPYASLVLLFLIGMLQKEKDAV